MPPDWQNTELNPMLVADFVVERLHGLGVRRIFGYPGDGIKGVIGALQRAGSIEFIQMRHEENGGL